MEGHRRELQPSTAPGTSDSYVTPCLGALGHEVAVWLVESGEAPSFRAIRRLIYGARSGELLSTARLAGKPRRLSCGPFCALTPPSVAGILGCVAARDGWRGLDGRAHFCFVLIGYFIG